MLTAAGIGLGAGDPAATGCDTSSKLRPMVSRNKWVNVFAFNVFAFIEQFSWVETGNGCMHLVATVAIYGYHSDGQKALRGAGWLAS